MDNDEARRLFLEQQNSEHTRATYARGLAVFAAFTEDKPYGDVTDADLVAWKASLSSLKPTSQFTRWTAVRSLFEWMLRSGRLTSTPFASVKAPKVTKNRTPRIPSDDAMTRLLRWAPGEERDCRDSAILWLLANGLRVGEVVGLNNEDIRVLPVDGENITVAFVRGKGNKERIVPLSEATISALNLWMLNRTDTSEASCPLFVDTVFGGRMTVRQAQTAVERRCEREGVTGVSAHGLRHHYATRLIRGGASAFDVQRLLGHESIATTQVYVNLDIRDSVKASRRDPMRFPLNEHFQQHHGVPIDPAQGEVADPEPSDNRARDWGINRQGVQTTLVS